MKTYWSKKEVPEGKYRPTTTQIYEAIKGYPATVFDPDITWDLVGGILVLDADKYTSGEYEGQIRGWRLRVPPAAIVMLAHILHAKHGCQWWVEKVEVTEGVLTLTVVSNFVSGQRGGLHEVKAVADIRPLPPFVRKDGTKGPPRFDAPVARARGGALKAALVSMGIGVVGIARRAPIVVQSAQGETEPEKPREEPESTEQEARDTEDLEPDDRTVDDEEYVYEAPANQEADFEEPAKKEPEQKPKKKEEPPKKAAPATSKLGKPQLIAGINSMFHAVLEEDNEEPLDKKSERELRDAYIFEVVVKQMKYKEAWETPEDLPYGVLKVVLNKLDQTAGGEDMAAKGFILGLVQRKKKDLAKKEKVDE